MTGPFWFGSPLALVVTAVLVGFLLGVALVVAGVIRLRRHHGTNQPDNTRGDKK